MSEVECACDVWGGEWDCEWCFFAFCVGAHFAAFFPGFIDFVFGVVVVVFLHVGLFEFILFEVFVEYNV